MKTSLLFGAVAVALFCASFSGGALTRKTLQCKASRNDVLCVRHSFVRQLPGRRHSRIKAGTAKRLGPGTFIQLTKNGVSDLYLGRAAQCRDLALSRAGTIFRTRFPTNSLLQQYRGDAYCTMADHRIMVVEANQKLSPLDSQSRRAPPRFSALVKADDSQGAPTEYRVRFYPLTKLVIATHRGNLSVQLSDGEQLSVSAGNEVTVSLPHGAIGSVTFGPATFSPAEESLFTNQLDLPDLTVTIQRASINCSTPSSCTRSVVYTLSNLGRAASPPVDVSVQAAPGMETTIHVRQIDPNKPIQLSTPVGPGPKCANPNCNARVVVDPNDTVLETNELNNVDTKTIDLPDLTVTIQRASINCPTPSSCTTTVVYTLSNLGIAASPSVDVLVQADPGLETTVHVRRIVPNKPIQLSTPVGPGPNCANPNCNVRVVVDPKDTVPETNEHNNVDTKTIVG